MADEDGFVRRWSRRKREACEQARRSAPAAAETAPTPPTPAEARAVEAPDAVAPAALPDIESLTYDSDFTVFLRSGVPAELRQRALRRLWRSDPLLANLDGLVEYGEDYSRIGTTEQIVSTAYRVGRGMLDRLEAGSLRPTTERADGAPATAPSPRNDGETAGTEPPALEADTGEDKLAGGAEETSGTAADPGDRARRPTGQESNRGHRPRPAPSAAPRSLPKRH
jgi:hypothetical protein